MRSIADKLVKLCRLPGQERQVLLQAWLLLILADPALRLFPFSTVLRRFNPACEPRATDLPLPVSRIAWLVEKAGVYCPTGTSCLKEALVLSRLLANRGISSTLRIGVGRQADRFTAHAWLEQDGLVILGDRDRDIATFTPLLTKEP